MLNKLVVRKLKKKGFQKALWCPPESIPQQKVHQPCRNASVMPTDSRGLLLNECCVLLPILIITDRRLFWVSDCNPSHWQNKMTSAETSGRIMFQTLSFT